MVASDDILNMYYETIKRIINYLSKRSMVDNNGLLRIYKSEVNIIWRLTGYYPVDYTNNNSSKPAKDSIGKYMITHESFIYAIWRWLQLGQPLDFNEFYMEINGTTEPLSKNGPLIYGSDEQ